MLVTTSLSDRDMVTAARDRQPVVVDRPGHTPVTGRLICWKGLRRPNACTVQLPSGAYLTVPAGTVAIAAP